jgi:anti-anti-sigma factor
MDMTRLLPLWRPPSVELLIRGDGTCVVTCSGELDAGNSKALGEALATAVVRRPQTIVVDLACVDFLDGHVVALLMDARAALARRGATLELVGRVGQPGRLLDAMGFDESASPRPAAADLGRLQAPSPPAGSEPAPSGSPRVKTSAATPSALT